jgi:UDP-glucose 4-epimerase
MSAALLAPTRVLITGSSGDLGSALAQRLRDDGHVVVGLDPVPGPQTDVVGSVADRDLVRRTLRDHGLRAVAHCGALHKPQVATHTRQAFVDTNVTGTLNLLEESVAEGSEVDRFVFTSTTSLMISKAIRAGVAGGATRAAWITEELSPLRPRNVYGVTKLAAEHVCRLMHDLHGLPLVILRTSRFFPEADDMAHAIAQSGPNTKANEMLFRRMAIDDVVGAHVHALARAPELGHDTFIVSARTPFEEEHCEELVADAPAVVRRLFPQYEEIYARRGWTMFDHIDRVYVSERMATVLGYVPQVDFARTLDELAAETPA